MRRGSKSKHVALMHGAIQLAARCGALNLLVAKVRGISDIVVLFQALLLVLSEWFQTQLLSLADLGIFRKFAAEAGHVDDLIHGGDGLLDGFVLLVVLAHEVLGKFRHVIVPQLALLNLYGTEGEEDDAAVFFELGDALVAHGQEDVERPDQLVHVLLDQVLATFGVNIVNQGLEVAVNRDLGVRAAGPVTKVLNRRGHLQERQQEVHLASTGAVTKRRGEATGGLALPWLPFNRRSGLAFRALDVRRHSILGRGCGGALGVVALRKRKLGKRTRPLLEFLEDVDCLLQVGLERHILDRDLFETLLGLLVLLVLNGQQMIFVMQLLFDFDNPAALGKAACTWARDLRKQCSS